MDMTTFYKILGYQIQKNNVISERALGNDVKDVEDKLVRAILYMEKGQCDFPKELNVKLIDTDCKPSEDYIIYPYQIAVDIPVSKLSELENLDYVFQIKSHYDPPSDQQNEELSFHVFDEDIKSNTVSDKDIPVKLATAKLTTEESNLTPYIVILISIVVIITAFVIFLRMRKRVKIEA